MGKRHYVERSRGEASYDLPAPMAREIGRIVVHWAYFEHYIQSMCWEVLGLTPAQGRVAVREPRCKDRLEMLRDLMKLRKGSWDEELYKSLHQAAEKAQPKRDLVAHGVWSKRPDGWYIQVARGIWDKKLSELVVGAKKIELEAKMMSSDNLREITDEITDEIAAMIADIKKLKRSAQNPPSSSPGTPA